ncbi:MAG: phospholipase D-like domain-containing protein [candidate division KSB1 bacterium]|nr:phospholipase D-like domain-containing protein [candidate division KSB1 bacterium]MDZ7335345.1 phospholipase D-like domain-containing protein [candidate division KSB1 bacterium]MDZ7356818.1 phospholipase D-like domain-containing protein [candidate division KSB1 bacterium]MDZ7399031.1 phospholipase D-like domain-containing protein [candidate division KSB1 bacterium]
MKSNVVLVAICVLFQAVVELPSLFSQAVQTSSGEIRVYFSQSVDPSYARYGRIAERTNIFNRFAQRVNSAKYSIDLCFYLIGSSDFDSPAQVLINAYKRGVKIRIIYDYDKNREESNAIRLLKEAKIPMISDRFGNNDGQAAMHNKFMVVDNRDTSSALDDWVWTGSYNLTKSATTENAENAIEIQDRALASCYTAEFNEMWGSDTDVPDPAKSRFSYRKTNNTPHKFIINGIEIQQYMSPTDGGVNFLVDAIQRSKSSLYFCMLIFQQSTNPNKIADAMRAKWQTIPDFKVKGVFDYEENYGNSSSQYLNMIGSGSKPWNPPADVHLDGEFGTLHHKYLIIDADGGPGQPMVVTGSYNWSNAAETLNDENFLIIKDSTIANLYLQEFADRYHKAGGKEPLIATSVDSDRERLHSRSPQLFQNYPNPFNDATAIHYQFDGHSLRDVELAIFNLMGQQIKTLVRGLQAGGSYQIFWDGTDDHGEAVSSGVYYYQLKLDEMRLMKKLIVLR